MADVEVRRVRPMPGSPCEAWAARVEDWIEDGERIIRLSREYRRHYRETICVKCSPERQAGRNCSALAPGCDIKSCAHMDRALSSRHRRIIAAHRESHPLMQRLRMNAALVRARDSRA